MAIYIGWKIAPSAAGDAVGDAAQKPVDTQDQGENMLRGFWRQVQLKLSIYNE